MSPVACCTPLLQYTSTEGERKQQGVKNSNLFRRNNAHLHHTVWNTSAVLWNQFKWRKDLVEKYSAVKCYTHFFFVKHP